MRPTRRATQWSGCTRSVIRNVRPPLLFSASLAAGSASMAFPLAASSASSSRRIASACSRWMAARAWASLASSAVPSAARALALWPIFMKFLKDQPVTSLVNSLTRPPLGTKWTRWATRGAGITDAVFTPGEEKDAVASARLELPDGVPRHGRDPGYAMLLLHFEPPAQSENRLMATGPVAWTDHMRRALELPDALNRLLTKQLGLSTSAPPPVVLGFRLEAQKDLAELIDITGLTNLPGGQHGSQAIGYFIDDSDGEPPGEAASRMIRHVLLYALQTER